MAITIITNNNVRHIYSENDDDGSHDDWTASDV